MIKVEVKVEGDLPDYSKQLSFFVARVAQLIRIRMREKLNEPKHGRLYRRKGGSGFSRSHKASAEGESPASDTKQFENSLQIVQKGSLESVLLTNLGYPGLLEEKRPLWEPTVNEMIPTLENELAQALA